MGPAAGLDWKMTLDGMLFVAGGQGPFWGQSPLKHAADTMLPVIPTTPYRLPGLLDRVEPMPPKTRDTFVRVEAATPLARAAANRKQSSI